MKHPFKLLFSCLLPLVLLLPLGGCSCGFDCNNDDDDDGNPALLSLGLSDSLPEDLTEVVIKVDAITLRRSGVEDVVIDTFTIDGLANVDSFQVDLLEYQGVKQLLVIEDLELAPGTYSGLSITILASSVNESYVQQADNDERKALRVSTGFQSLPGFQLVSGSQTYTVEFGLGQALEYDDATDTYLMTTNGVRIEDNTTAARLSGTVDSDLFDSVVPCSEKGTPTKGNRVYLYEGTRLLAENLADVFTSQSDTAAPDNAIAPFAVASMVIDDFTENWKYSFGFIPAGSYTIAFACDTEADDAVNYNGLTIPLPIDQKYEITLTEGQNGTCNLVPDGGGSC
ncbi:MAG: DUF4382 domain-containing protein [Halioglobus sp.]|nr:DUF4382 domain-containing protein [Halioglobus sp.]